MANILIIDDDRAICDMMSHLIKRMGYNVSYCLKLKDGLKKATEEPFDLILLDVFLPDGNGLCTLPEFLDTPSVPEIIIMTGQGTPDSAEEAINAGSWTYIQKPFSAEEIRKEIPRVLKYREEKVARKPLVGLKRQGIIGSSAHIRRCLNDVARAGITGVNVLLIGETGTGKELFARAIHDNSNRSTKPFVVVDCAALPETLVESVIFGHAKGAFTGADQAREGLIKQADGGTLFLDEIGELPMTIQSTFLRVLQEHSFRSVGGKTEITSDFRLIAATNRDLEAMVRAGRFRNDLLFRIRSIEIDLPPLRNRAKDIKDLAFQYMSKFCDRYGIKTKEISPDFLRMLMDYNWPGNVRELINALEMAISMARDEQTLFPIHMPNHIRAYITRKAIVSKQEKISGEEDSPKTADSFPNKKELLVKTERKYFQDLVAFTNGEIKEICKISGLSRANVYAHLKKYNIPRQFSKEEKE